MRDPARINRMIEKLRALWLSTPDQRLGQLVGNLCDGQGMSFYVEDDVMEKSIELATAHGFAGLYKRSRR